MKKALRDYKYQKGAKDELKRFNFIFSMRSYTGIKLSKINKT